MEKLDNVPQGRLVSLDAFRGFTMAFMFVVLNHGIWNPKVVWSQLFHPEWSGFTITDLVMPFFIFIVGVALPFSYAKRLSRGEMFSSQVRHAIRRALLLIIFGIFININSSGQVQIRLGGVLQVIGFCYLFAFLTLPLRVRTQALIAAAILIGYYLLFKVLPLPPGADNPFVKGNNIGTVFDMWLLGWTHPEGYVTINILPAIPTCILGIMVGKLLQNDSSAGRKIAILLIGGVAGVLLGWLLNPVIPINKKLWTSSFALFVGGWSCIFFAFFYWIIDVRGYKKWTWPLVVYGLNPITIYMINTLMKPWILVHWKITANGEAITLKRAIVRPLVEWFGPTWGSLAYTAIIVIFLWYICYWMYRRRIFLKL